MDFFDRITRSPQPFQPEIGADVAQLFCDFPEQGRALVAGTAGCSPYLAGLLRREVEWIAQLRNHSPEALRDAVLADVRGSAGSDMGPVFRQAKRRLALLAGLADLGGVWPLEDVSGALTDLADACVDQGVKSLVQDEIRRGKLPGGLAADAEIAGGMVVLAMGKMGARELNYSSDIDLICLFDETRFEPDDYHEARSCFVRVTRRMAALLSDVTAEGYVFRTDLRLRPDASVTPVCIAMEAAERYYESVGRTWERAAFIKARACAGDIAAGEAFLERLTPFVWRKHLDFAAIQDAHDMRLLIRDHKGLGGKLALEGHNMKLGQGGIREIEFFTQTRQLIAGGRDPSLRSRQTLEGLKCLTNANWIPEAVCAQLSDNYRAHREIEHRLQMIGDAQTHDLPSDPEGFARLAAFTGQQEAALRDDIMARLVQTSELTEAFFAPEDGAEEAGKAAPYLEKWRNLPALRSPRSAEIFNRVFPEILTGLQRASRPEEALQAFELFLTGLPAGVQVLSLFEANPQLTQLIVDICAASSTLAAYLSRNAHVFDAVLGGAFFSDWPDQAGLADDLSPRLAAAADYEAQLDLARRWQKEWHFRIGVHQLRGLITPEQAAGQYADLAAAVLEGLFPVVQQQFAAKHGSAPGRGAVILAMGSLGAAGLTASSDLDLIMIYDAQGVDSSDGGRPLATRAYFARLTQALVTALSALTAEGKLYEVDMRLRPSGQSGPVATSFDAFESYQSDQAWLWEHMALTRARSLCGAPELMADVERVRTDILTRNRARPETAIEAQEMRQRLADAGRSGGTWDVKDGPGGVQDIELFAQMLALLTGCLRRDTAGQIASAVESALLSTAQGAELAAAHDIFGRVTQTARLLAGQAVSPEALGEGGQAMMLRDMGATDVAQAAATLDKCRKQAQSLIERTISKLQGDVS